MMPDRGAKKLAAVRADRLELPSRSGAISKDTGPVVSGRRQHP